MYFESQKKILIIFTIRSCSLSGTNLDETINLNENVTPLAVTDIMSSRKFFDRPMIPIGKSLHHLAYEISHSSKGFLDQEYEIYDLL